MRAIRGGVEVGRRPAGGGGDVVHVRPQLERAQHEEPVDVRGQVVGEHRMIGRDRGGGLDDAPGQLVPALRDGGPRQRLEGGDHRSRRLEVIGDGGRVGLRTHEPGQRQLLHAGDVGHERAHVRVRRAHGRRLPLGAVQRGQQFVEVLDRLGEGGARRAGLGSADDVAGGTALEGAGQHVEPQAVRGVGPTVEGEVDQREEGAHLVVGFRGGVGHVHARAFSGPIIVRRRANANLMRDLAVPSGMPRMLATSRYVRPSK